MTHTNFRDGNFSSHVLGKRVAIYLRPSIVWRGIVFDPWSTSFDFWHLVYTFLTLLV